VPGLKKRGLADANVKKIGDSFSEDAKKDQRRDQLAEV